MRRTFLLVGLAVLLVVVVGVAAAVAGGAASKKPLGVSYANQYLAIVDPAYAADTKFDGLPTTAAPATVAAASQQIAAAWAAADTKLTGAAWPANVRAAIDTMVRDDGPVIADMDQAGTSAMLAPGWQTAYTSASGMWHADLLVVQGLLGLQPGS